MLLGLSNSFPLLNCFYCEDHYFVALIECLNSSDGRVVRASASGAVDSGVMTSRVKPMTLKLVFTAALLDVQH